jgi:Lantibiotic dehydratase, N terminus
MANPLISSGLADAANSWLDREDELQSRSDALSEELYRIVPNEPDRKTRAQLIDLRRTLHGSLRPVPGALLHSALASPAVSGDIKSSLVRHAAERLEFAVERERMDQLYEDALARERAELLSVTADEAFRKALYVASPGTLGALARLPAATEKQRRRLEETLHSYLMRAVGRATPNGAWSGVAMEGQREQQSRVIFTVLLDPFAAAIKAIANQERWRSEVPLRINPTLRQCGSVWRFDRFHDGAWQSYDVHDQPLIAQLSELLGKNHALPADICARQDLVEAGILLPTLDLPRIFSDSWHALEQVVPCLPASEQDAWSECIRNLRELSEQLGREYDSLPLEALQAGLDTARFLVNALLQRYGLSPVSEDRHVLLGDRRVTISSPLPSDLNARLERAIRSYWSFDRYGMGEKNASNVRRLAFGKFPEVGMPLGDLASRNTAEPVSPEPVSPEPVSEDETDYLERWHNELAPVAHNRQHALATRESSCPVPPGSALLLLDASGHLRVGSITPDPCFFYSRWNALFRTAGGGDDPFCEWYRTGVQHTESAFPELLFTDVAFPSAANRNSAARLNMTGRVLDASRDGTATLRLYSDSTDWPKLRAGAAAQAIVPRLHSAARLNGSDPHALVIQQFSFLLGRPNLLRPLPRFPEESETWHHLPRLTLDDFLVNPERWTPGPELLDALRASKGSQRYLAWRRYVREAGIPDLVYIRAGGADEQFLLCSDSALAVDLLGRRLHKHGGPLLIQEAWPSPRNSWLQDEHGFHYAAELALAWHGDQAFWASYLGYAQA